MGHGFAAGTAAERKALAQPARRYRGCKAEGTCPAGRFGEILATKKRPQ
ncbi:hypothetical protein BKA07_002192 [Brevibacterium marinum]|uniref:Uncharacterized protein n=1 Tax=Brevibacterium marinum TaxID=418643 RepID=A0A846S8N3_9MICO|nr:hypothetical protein [Brevibacterium marinum]